MVFETGDELIKVAFAQVLDHGQFSSPRGMEVLELSDVPTVLTLADVTRPFLESHVRNANYRFGLAEALWILSGSEDAKLIGGFNKQMLNYSDDGNTMWGAYGPRIISQLPHVLNVLKSDRSSRQAVLQTWRPQVSKVYDIGSNIRAAGIVDASFAETVGHPEWDGSSWKTKDTPCTVSWHFMIRDDRLNLNVYMRSNDAWLGLPYDLLSFTTVQRVVAALLCVEPGTYSHIVGNLHLYKQHWAGAKEVITFAENVDTIPPLPDFDEFNGLTINDVVCAAKHALMLERSGDDGFIGLAPYAAAVARDTSDPIYGAVVRASRKLH